MSRVEVTDEQIREAQAGDGDAMWAIVSAFDPMLSSVIKSVAPGANAEDREDLLQEARAVLIQHIRDYDSSTSSALSRPSRTGPSAESSRRSGSVRRRG